MNCIIVDDEPLAREAMKLLIEESDNLQLIGSFNSAATASDFMEQQGVDLVFLDIQKKNDIRCASIEQEARNLSGGNQQKIILAREMENHPELLVAVHPTRGLDIGASQYVHDTMIEARDKGCGILLISADFDEVLKLSDRIMVMFEGQVMGIYPGENPPVEEISLAMAGKEE